jgi:hypothetical protein
LCVTIVVRLDIILLIVGRNVVDIVVVSVVDVVVSLVRNVCIMIVNM